MIDLKQLNSGVKTEIIIDEVISIEESFLEDSEIIELKEVRAQGKITKNNSLDNIINIVVDGKMILADSISLEPVEYQFSFEIEDEILEKNTVSENSLDFIAFLWQNIILEIPLKFTKVNDLSEFQGTGWKLISEDELKVANNPFNDLKSKLGEE